MPVADIGPGWVLAWDATSFFLSAAVLFTLPVGRVKRGLRTGMLAELLPHAAAPFRDPKRVRCDALAGQLTADGFTVEAMLTGLIVRLGARGIVVVCLPYGPDDRLWFLAEPERVPLAAADKVTDAVAAIRVRLTTTRTDQEAAAELRERQMRAFVQHSVALRSTVSHHCHSMDLPEITVLLEYLTDVIDSIWGTLGHLDHNVGDRAGSLGRDGQAVIDAALVDLSLGHDGLEVARHLISHAKVGLMSLEEDQPLCRRRRH